MNIPGQVAMRDGLVARSESLQAEARARGGREVSLDIKVAGDGVVGIERQIAQMVEMVEARPDLIIVQPTDSAALSEPLLRANALGVPVIAFDQYVSRGTLASYITSDNYQAGWLDGEYIAWRFPDDRPIRLILVEYPVVSSTVERVDGFMDALAQLHQPYEVLKTYQAVEPVKGKEVGRQLLSDFPVRGSVDVVFTVNDGGGVALAEELRQAGRTEISIATIDGDPASVASVREESLTVVDSAQFCWQMGAVAMETGARLLSGEDVEATILIPVFPVTRETQDVYSGWYGPVPVPYEKPWPSPHPIWKWETASKGARPPSDRAGLE
ncbi:MAG: substrate-binding domain-containing protein [Deltaproteobacteria bacterium]|nr:substrate-binding domain-containing protein [Deltaproteobacteria bacterium]